MSGMLEFAQAMSPLGNADAEDCANYCITLFSDLTRKVTMQNLYHDGGFSSMGMSLRAMTAYEKGLEEYMDENGNIIEIKCTYDPTSKPGAGEWRSVKGTIHWVDASQAVKAEVRLYENIIDEEKGKLNPISQKYRSVTNMKGFLLSFVFNLIILSSLGCSPGT